MRRRPDDPPQVRKHTPQNGIAIRALRERMGVELEEMAAFLGKSVAHIRNIELEHKAARPEQIALIAQRLELPIAAIVRGQPPADDLPPLGDGSVEEPA